VNPFGFVISVAKYSSAEHATASSNAVAMPLCLNAAPRDAGQQYSSYERSRISASVCGTLMPNSCGGAYWHA